MSHFGARARRDGDAALAAREAAGPAPFHAGARRVGGDRHAQGRFAFLLACCVLGAALLVPRASHAQIRERTEADVAAAAARSKAAVPRALPAAPKAAPQDFAAVPAQASASPAPSASTAAPGVPAEAAATGQPPLRAASGMAVAPQSGTVASVVAGPAPAGAADGSSVRDGDARRWSLLPEHGTVRGSIALWAAAAGWSLVWDLPVDFAIENPAHFDGTFEEAIARLAQGSWAASNAFQATFYRGNRVLRIALMGTHK